MERSRPCFFLVILSVGLLCTAEKKDLHVLVLNPHPGPKVFWGGGHFLFPAAQLAADMMNNRSDILADYAIRLVDGDSGCELATKSTVTAVREVITPTDRNFVGMVGPACTVAATEIGGINALPIGPIDLVTIIIANGPRLRDYDYQNMFGLVSSGRLVGKAAFKLIEYNNWRTVAVVYNLHQEFHLQIYSHFRDTITSSGYAEHPLIFHQENVFLVNSIYNFNVVFVIAGLSISKRSLCLALKSRWKVIHQSYQWIFFSIPEEQLISDVEFTYAGQVYSCTKDEMAEATIGAVILNFRLTREEKMNKTDVGLSYNDYLSQYEMYLDDHLKKRNSSQEVHPPDAKVWSSKYFDSMWAMGLALNSSIPILREAGVSLDDRQHREVITSTVREQLLKVEFEGLSGNVQFDNNTREVPTIVDIYQIHQNSNIVHIGYYYKGDLIIKDESGAYFAEPIQKQLIVANSGAVTLFFIIALLLFLLTGCLHIIHLIFHRYKSIRAQSPRFSHFLFSGCYLYILSALLESTRVSSWLGTNDVGLKSFLITFGILCNAIIWCLTLGTALIFGTLCVLSWRLYRIFTHYVRPGKFISDPVLVCLIIVFISINISVLLAWNAFDPLLPQFELTTFSLNRRYVQAHCHCEQLGWLVLWVLNESIVLMVVLFAIVNRKVPKKDFFNNTKSHGIMVYLVSILSGLGIPIYFSHGIRDINTSYVFFQIFTLGCACITCIFLFIPPIIPLLQKIKHTYLATIIRRTVL